MRILAILVFSLLLTGCAKDHKCDCEMPHEIYYLKAKVVQVADICCGLRVLDFSEDSIRIRMAMNRSDLVYSAINLPANFAVKDKKLYVSVAVLQPGEYPLCTTLCPDYLPLLKIVDAKSRE